MHKEGYGKEVEVCGSAFSACGFGFSPSIIKYKLPVQCHLLQGVFASLCSYRCLEVSHAETESLYKTSYALDAVLCS